MNMNFWEVSFKGDVSRKYLPVLVHLVSTYKEGNETVGSGFCGEHVIQQDFLIEELPLERWVFPGGALTGAKTEHIRQRVNTCKLDQRRNEAFEYSSKCISMEPKYK